MPLASIEIYMEQLPARMSEMRLLLTDTTMMPHVKESDRKRATSSWNRTISMSSRVPARKASPAVLKFMGIGVEHV